MKKISLSVLIIITAFACANSSIKNNNKQAKSSNSFAVVELFTSEGCSSCPPADNAVAKILKEYNNNVYVLGYHVDYWDDLGWKDAFSNNAFTQRQKEYAKLFKQGSVYTPQVVINGEEQFVGSDKNKLHASINKDLAIASQQKLFITAKAINNTINISYNASSINNNLNIALVQLAAETQVQRGENHGATLHHVNVVRSLQTLHLKNNNGITVFNLPEGLSANDCAIIAFTQNTNMKITCAAKAKIQL